MAQQPRNVLYSYFETADIPPEEHFRDLIDSFTNKLDDGAPVAFVPPPLLPTSPGQPGQLAWDTDYLYICTGISQWKRTAIAEWE